MLHLPNHICYDCVSSKPTRADSQKQQQKPEESGLTPVSAEPKSSSSVLAVQDQRKALKFGFSSKGGSSKVNLQSLLKRVYLPLDQHLVTINIKFASLPI